MRVRSMQVQEKRLLSDLTLWLAAELLLTLVGLDTLADYSEFLTSQTNLHRPDDLQELISTIAFNQV